MEQANAIGGFPNQQRQKYDPFSNTYNPGWRDHPKFSYANQRAAAPNPVFNRKSGFQFQPKPQQANQDQGTTVDEKLNFIITSMMQDKQEKHKTDMAINKHNFSN